MVPCAASVRPVGMLIAINAAMPIARRREGYIAFSMRLRPPGERLHHVSAQREPADLCRQVAR